jgi:cell wall-associated NlpC family hydrolase
MISNFIGIPFVSKGRSFNGCDCYGLVKLYYKEILNIDIPETIITAEQPRRTFANYLNEISKNWTATTPAKNVVVAMSVNAEHPNLVTHFAVMIDDKRFIDTRENMSSYLTSIDDEKIKNQIKGFYKWQH